MFKEIFRFEVRQGFRSTSTYIFFSLFFIIYFLMGLITTGVLPLATGDTNTWVNSATVVTGLLIGLNQNIFGLVNSLIMVALLATSIQKDYEYNMHPLLYTKPINKRGYFFGRFAGSFLIAAWVFSAQILGYFLATLVGSGQPTVGPCAIANFLEPFFLFTIPNLFLLGIVFFSLSTFTRNNLPAYLFCIILLVVRSVTDAIDNDLDNKSLAAVLEPFGESAFNKITEYWTPAEQNSRLIPLRGELLINRLLWLSISSVLTFIAYKRFQFSQFLTRVSWFGKKIDHATSNVPTAGVQLFNRGTNVTYFSVSAKWRTWWHLSLFEFRKMVRSSFFLIIVGLGIAMMIILSRFGDVLYGTPTYPVTYNILGVISGGFQFFIVILLVIYSGTIIWRDRETRMDELVGVTPTSNPIFFFSKYAGMVLTTLLLLAVVMVTGVLIQLSQGFTQVQLIQYFKELYGLRFPGFIVVTGMCLFIQVFSPNKYVGFFISILVIVVLRIIFNMLEIQNDLLLFNSNGPALPYSDMNGYGHFPGIFIIYKTYWLSFVAILSLLSIQFYGRGKEKSFRKRYRLSGKINRWGLRVSGIVILAIMLSTGFVIYYKTRILHKYETPKEMEESAVSSEKKYRQYLRLLQPRIVESTIVVDLYPDSRNMRARGSFWIKNKHQLGIDTLFLHYDNSFNYHKLALDCDFQILVNDTINGFRIIKLAKKMLSGDSLCLNFDVEFVSDNFSEKGWQKEIVFNGTFINSGFLPGIGYPEESELESNAARKKYGLPEKPRLASVYDTVARRNTYISSDSDWIRFQAIIGTEKDQIALAPGYLQKEWVMGDRKYYYYKMDAPILNFYSFLSARYDVLRDRWKNVNLEIYYNRGHEYNLNRMMYAMKKSLEYYTSQFSPYQHKQLRILEFPRYNSFAQSFPNTIPYSESIGFIAKVDSTDPESIDYPFYVTAHEVAHQWWAHQVIGGNVQGCTVLSETMSQYSALMVMEKVYGKAAMKKFLKYEMNVYLTGRSRESKKELPLMLCENQQYIHYNKGSVIMYALRDYLGEDTLNAALKKFIRKTAFQNPPYTTTIEFVNAIREVTPDSLKYIIVDMFESITLYENYVRKLSVNKVANGKYKVSITVGCAKFKADSLGKQKRVGVNDYVDIGIFGEGKKNGKTNELELMLVKVKMDKAEKTFEFYLDKEPIKAGIDPYLKLIDRNPENNSCKFGSAPLEPELSEIGADNLTISL